MNHWKAVLEQDFLTGIMLQRGNGTTQNDTFGYNPRSERVTWDPSQATVTRPLAIQKDGTWFTYGYDITKNVCEVFGADGNATLICTVTGMSQTPVTSALVV